MCDFGVPCPQAAASDRFLLLRFTKSNSARWPHDGRSSRSCLCWAVQGNHGLPALSPLSLWATAPLSALLPQLLPPLRDLPGPRTE